MLVIDPGTPRGKLKFLVVLVLTTRRALGRREVREEARAAKHVNAKQAHSKQPGPLKLLHLMRSCDPEKKPDFILLISGSTKIA